MLVTNISEFDAGEYISTFLQASLDDISKARGVIQIAAGEAGVGRETE